MGQAVTETTVSVDSVVRTFSDTRAVDEVTFDVRQGEVFGLLGHNGAGKTTLIRVINGLLPADSGTVRTLGLDPVVDGDRVRARTGVLTEYPALDDFLTPAENLQVYGAVHGVEPALARSRVAVLVERLGLGAHVDQPARSLSAGLKQRLALARSLIHDPELLLLDEPTSNLDPLAARGVRDLVLELSRERGRTVLLSTHNLIEAQTLCDRVAIIKQGELLACGSLDQLGHDLDRGTVHITVDEADVGTTLSILERQGVDGAALLASGDTVAAALARGLVPNIVTALVHADVRVLAVTPQSPTLEDVYVALHGARRDAVSIPADLP